MTIKSKRGGATAAPRCAYNSQSFELNSTFVLTAPSYGAVFFGSAQQLAAGLQSIFHPQSGAAYYGTPIQFWISLPQGDLAPTDWYYEDIINAPGTQIPVIFSEADCYETLTCWSFFYRVFDVNQWFSYYIAAAVGTNEFTPFVPYSDAGYYATLLTCINTLFGSQAGATFSYDAGTNEITMTLTNITQSTAPVIVSTPDFATFQSDSGSLIKC